MSVDLWALSIHSSPLRETMGLGTYYFDILQCVACWRHGVGLRVDVRHIAPIGCCITVFAGWTVGITEDESKDIRAVDHGFEVIDLSFVRWIPRAVEASSILLRARNFGSWTNEGKVSEVNPRPKDDEKQESSGVCARHSSYLVGFSVSWKELVPKEGSSTA